MNQINNFKLGRIKAKALELYKSRQLPFALTRAIYELKADYDPKYIAIVMSLTEEYMRVSNYYRKYPQHEKEANERITEILTKGDKYV